MKYLLYFALGALALRLADTLWQMVVSASVYEEDLLHVCGTCGRELQIVRPGKYQCGHCEQYELVITYEGGGEETTVTPPWEYEIYWN